MAFRSVLLSALAIALFQVLVIFAWTVAVALQLGLLFIFLPFILLHCCQTNLVTLAPKTFKWLTKYLQVE